MNKDLTKEELRNILNISMDTIECTNSEYDDRIYHQLDNSIKDINKFHMYRGAINDYYKWIYN